MNAAKFLRLHSIFDCLWTTTQSWVVAKRCMVYKASIRLSTEKFSGIDDLVLKLHKCVVLINSFLCIKKH